MTPDELRRMDNDLCIIFVKGLRPIKADKFYYFKHPMAKELAKYEISHNDIGDIDRGTWRKYNPYNPYVPEDEKEKQAEDLKIESLDDLFEDDKDIGEKGETENKKIESAFGSDMIADLANDKIENNVEKEKNKYEDNEYDLQKELEAKFDELFGPIEDNNEE